MARKSHKLDGDDRRDVRETWRNNSCVNNRHNFEYSILRLYNLCYYRLRFWKLLKHSWQELQYLRKIKVWCFFGAEEHIVVTYGYGEWEYTKCHVDLRNLDCEYIIIQGELFRLRLSLRRTSIIGNNRRATYADWQTVSVHDIATTR